MTARANLASDVTVKGSGRRDEQGDSSSFYNVGGAMPHHYMYIASVALCSPDEDFGQNTLVLSSFEIKDFYLLL